MRSADHSLARLIIAAAALVLIAVAPTGGVAQDAEQNGSERVLQSGLTERVRVFLRQIDFLVVDKAAAQTAPSKEAAKEGELAEKQVAKVEKPVGPADEFNRDSLNIIILYWYHPPAYWDFLALNQRVNTQIMQEFEKEGIKFAFPTTTTHLGRDVQKPFEIVIAGETQLLG